MESGVSKTRTLPVPQARLSSLDPISPHPAICIQLYFEEETEELNGSLFCQEEAIFFSSLPYLQPQPKIPNILKNFTKIKIFLKKKKKKKKKKEVEPTKGGCPTEVDQHFIQVLIACREVTRLLPRVLRLRNIPSLTPYPKNY